ncbi:hypothetical protein AVEN_179687-1 [Araneus ventricosus]|uniref:Gustatory receptor n=1 Tax=Araneus ventricosus TaxID=182803 RepID=A0A4Y2X1Z0_ARAVE|nr:hypothetical protein AVEN_179687-1 [Araneus ventricosus]
MVGLFWKCYTLAFATHMSNEEYVSLISFICYFLSFHVMIILSASLANEMAIKPKGFAQFLPCRLPTLLNPQFQSMLKEIGIQKYRLTLWQFYVLRRSILLASIGTLLTYGILLGTLGKHSQ